MSLYLVFEHVHQDLASYLEKCPPPGLPQDRIKVNTSLWFLLLRLSDLRNSLLVHHLANSERSGFPTQPSDRSSRSETTKLTCHQRWRCQTHRFRLGTHLRILYTFDLSCCHSMVSKSRSPHGSQLCYACRYLVLWLHFCRIVPTQAIVSRSVRNGSVVQDLRGHWHTQWRRVAGKGRFDPVKLWSLSSEILEGSLPRNGSSGSRFSSSKRHTFSKKTLFFKLIFVTENAVLFPE